MSTPHKSACCASGTTSLELPLLTNKSFDSPSATTFSLGTDCNIEPFAIFADLAQAQLFSSKLEADANLRWCLVRAPTEAVAFCWYQTEARKHERRGTEN